MKKFIFILLIILVKFSFSQEYTMTDSIVVFHHPDDDVVKYNQVGRVWNTLNNFTTGRTIRFFSGDGSPLNTGLTEDSPLPMDSINTLAVDSATIMATERGTVWYGTIIGRSNLKYISYGSGTPPIIKGSSEITGWENYSGNVFKATFASAINQLFEDDVRSQFSTYPSDTYLTVTEKISSTRFRCSDLDGMNLTGSYVLARLVGWSYESRKIIAQSGDTLTVESAFYYDYAFDASGDIFKIINSIDFLTSAGEMVYNESTGDVYLWTSGSDSPANYTIEGSVLSNGFTGSNLSNVVIKGIKFSRFKENGIYLTGKNDNITVRNCEFDYNYGSAINIYADTSATGNVYTNNIIDGSNRNGIMVTGDSCTISSNIISNIALADNIGIDGLVDAMAAGTGISAPTLHNSYVESNILDGIGYNGISFGGINDTVRYNYGEGSKTHCLTLDDGGFIYTNKRNSTGSYIGKNININEIDSMTNYIAGVYVDAIVEGLTVDSNIVVGNSYGIQTNNIINCNITGNTCFNNEWHQILIREYTSGLNGGSNYLSGNIMFSTGVYQIRTLKIWGFDFSAMNLTISDNVFGMSATDNIYFIDQSEVIWDALATISEVNAWTGQTIGTYPTVSNYDNAQLFYNASSVSVEQDLSGNTWKDLDGNVVSSLTLQPFTSKILIAD